MSQLQPAALAALRHSAPALLASLLVVPLAGCSVSYGGAGKESVTETHQLSAAGPLESLKINNKIGDITIVSDENASDVSASLRITGRGHTPEEARESLEQVRVSLARAEHIGRNAALGEVTVPKQFFKQDGRGYSVDWTITTPPNLFVRVNNDVGNVDVEHIVGGAHVGVDVGNVNASNIDNGLIVSTDVGNVRARSISGGLNASADVGDINGHVVEGPVDASTDVGTISLELTGNSADSVAAKSDVGDISLVLPAAAAGMIDAATDQGRVSIRLSEEELSRVFTREGTRFKGEVGTGSQASFHLRSEVGAIRVSTARGS